MRGLSDLSNRMALILTPAGRVLGYENLLSVYLLGHNSLALAAEGVTIEFGWGLDMPIIRLCNILRLQE
jgi:hypothetical protein